MRFPNILPYPLAPLAPEIKTKSPVIWYFGYRGEGGGSSLGIAIDPRTRIERIKIVFMIKK